MHFFTRVRLQNDTTHRTLYSRAADQDLILTYTWRRYASRCIAPLSFFLPSLPERRRKKKPSARVERTVDCNKSNIGRPAPGRRHTGVAADGRRYNKRAPPTTCLICLDVINHIFIYLERPPRIDGWGLAGRQSFVKKISMRFSIGQREIKKINNKSSRGKKKKKEYAKDNNKTTEHSSSIDPYSALTAVDAARWGLISRSGIANPKLHQSITFFDMLLPIVSLFPPQCLDVSVQ